MTPNAKSEDLNLVDTNLLCQFDYSQSLHNVLNMFKLIVCKNSGRLQSQIDQSFTDCIANQVESRRLTQMAAPSRFCVK